MAQQLADLYAPQYTPGASNQGGIVGPSPSDIAYKLMPEMQGPSPSDIRVVPTSKAARDHAMALALARARHHGKAKYAVDVGEPQIAPQYAVDVGEPQIEQSGAATAARDANDARIRAAIAAKLTRAPVMGHVTDSNLVPMAQLASVGVSADPNAEGIPYGLDPSQLNGVERGWLQRRTR